MNWILLGAEEIVFNFDYNAHKINLQETPDNESFILCNFASFNHGVVLLEVAMVLQILIN